MPFLSLSKVLEHQRELKPLQLTRKITILPHLSWSNNYSWRKRRHIFMPAPQCQYPLWHHYPHHYQYIIPKKEIYYTPCSRILSVSHLSSLRYSRLDARQAKSMTKAYGVAFSNTDSAYNTSHIHQQINK